jgi:Iron-sulfur cluster-binding domain
MWDGRVLLCCNDWGHREVGDITRQSVAQVWNSDEMNHQRYLLYHGLNDQSSICVDCSYGNEFSRSMLGRSRP